MGKQQEFFDPHDFPKVLYRKGPPVFMEGGEAIIHRIYERRKREGRRPRKSGRKETEKVKEEGESEVKV